MRSKCILPVIFAGVEALKLASIPVRIYPNFRALNPESRRQTQGIEDEEEDENEDENGSPFFEFFSECPMADELTTLSN